MKLNGRFYFSFQQKPSTFDGSILTGILTIQIRHLSSAAEPARLCSAGVLRTQFCKAPPATIYANAGPDQVGQRFSFLHKSNKMHRY